MKIIIIALLFYLYSKCICNNSEFSEYCNKKGIYNQDTHKCKCIENYISLEEDNMECIYQKKSKTIAQIMSIFGGFLGAEQFYLGNNFKGFAKVFIPIITFLLIIYSKSFLKEKIDLPEYFLVIPIILLIVFWIVDILFIFFGFTKDSKGIELV